MRNWRQEQPPFRTVAFCIGSSPTSCSSDIYPIPVARTWTFVTCVSYAVEGYQRTVESNASVDEPQRIGQFKSLANALQ